MRAYYWVGIVIVVGYFINGFLTGQFSLHPFWRATMTDVMKLIIYILMYSFVFDYLSKGGEKGVPEFRLMVGTFYGALIIGTLFVDGDQAELIMIGVVLLVFVMRQGRKLMEERYGDKLKRFWADDIPKELEERIEHLKKVKKELEQRKEEIKEAGKMTIDLAEIRAAASTTGTTATNTFEVKNVSEEMLKMITKKDPTGKDFDIASLGAEALDGLIDKIEDFLKRYGTGKRRDLTARLSKESGGGDETIITEIYEEALIASQRLYLVASQLRGRGISPKIKTAKVRTSIITGEDDDRKAISVARHGQVYKLFTGESDVMKKLSDSLTLVNGAVQTVSAISENARISENGIGKDLEYNNWDIVDDAHIEYACGVKGWNLSGLGGAGPNNPLENDSYTQAAEKLNNIIMDGDTSFKERLDDRDLEVLDFNEACDGSSSDATHRRIPRQLLRWESSCALDDAHHRNFCNSEGADGHLGGTQGENENGRIYAIGETTTTGGQDWSDEVLTVRRG
ncbi:TPA: hypothetical protein H1011_00805 [archaeon]|uniref:Uncharacterized protein n=1 Tax=Candidatus Undinarchaeum marinum TaxID=2756141 RepID=A0A832XFN7_9ARCH|nr:hypothetical protein [Candidatus Undinarchaeum marinum]